MKLQMFAAAVLATGAVSNANAEVELLDLSPFYTEVVSISPGTEMVQPYMKDVDADTILEGIAFHFGVDPADSNTRLFGTAIRSVIYPDMPCTSPVWVDRTLSGITFLGKDVLRSHIAISVAVECQESTSEIKQAYKTFVYSAAVNAAGGAEWTKVYNLELLGFDGIDVDGDTTNELALTMVVPMTVPGSVEALNTRTVAMEGQDGAIVFDKQRLLVR